MPCPANCIGAADAGRAAAQLRKQETSKTRRGKPQNERVFLARSCFCAKRSDCAAGVSLASCWLLPTRQGSRDLHSAQRQWPSITPTRLYLRNPSARLSSSATHHCLRPFISATLLVRVWEDSWTYYPHSVRRTSRPQITATATDAITSL